MPRPVQASARPGEVDGLRNRAGHLPPREREVLRLRALGMAYKAIAGALGVERSTVQTLLKLSKARLDVETENEAWMLLGWLVVPDA